MSTTSLATRSLGALAAAGALVAGSIAGWSSAASAASAPVAAAPAAWAPPQAPGGPAPAATAPSAQDQAWITGNAQGDMAEIAAGTVMERKGASWAVRYDAATFVRDHSYVLAGLRVLAAHEGVTLPTTLTAAQQAEGAAVNGDPAGPALDATYVQDEIAGHEQSIAQTVAELRTGSARPVVDYARFYLPIAERHLFLLQATESGRF